MAFGVRSEQQFIPKIPRGILSGYLQRPALDYKGAFEMPQA